MGNRGFHNSKTEKLELSEGGWGYISKSKLKVAPVDRSSWGLEKSPGGHCHFLLTKHYIITGIWIWRVTQTSLRSHFRCTRLLTSNFLQLSSHCTQCTWTEHRSVSQSLDISSRDGMWTRNIVVSRVWNQNRLRASFLAYPLNATMI